MKKVLDLQECIVDVYNGYACTTSIILENNAGRNWFVQNYLNYMVSYNEDYDYVIFDYFYSDTFFNTAINCFQPENMVSFPYSCYSVPATEVNDIIGFVKELINREFYICLFVNCKYLSKYHETEDFIHDIFIYGYDDEKEIVYSTGYIGGQKYTKLEHTFGELVKAYGTMNVKSVVHSRFDTNRITFFKYKDNFKYQFNINKFICSLKEYLNLDDGCENIKREVYLDTTFKTKTAYGIEGIKVLIEYLKTIDTKKFLDIRQIYFLYNHKKNMKYKLQFLYDTQYLVDNKIINEYEEVIKTANICLNIAIKYSLVKKEKLINNMIIQLKKMYSIEYFILEYLIEKFNKRRF